MSLMVLLSACRTQGDTARSSHEQCALSSVLISPALPCCASRSRSRSSPAMPADRFVKWQGQPTASRCSLDNDSESLISLTSFHGEAGTVLSCGSEPVLLQRGREVGRLARSRAPCVAAIAVPFAHGPKLYTSQLDGEVRVFESSFLKLSGSWTCDYPQLCFGLPGPPPNCTSKEIAAFQPHRLISGDTVGQVNVWELTGALTEPTATFQAHDDLVSGVLLPKSNDHVVATSSWDSTVKLWDIETMGAGAVPTRTITYHTMPVFGMCDIPSVDLVASFGQNRAVSVWNPSVASVLQRLEGHDRPIAAVFAGAGSEIISVDRGGTVKTWDCRTWQELQSVNSDFMTEEDSVAGACYDRLGDRVVQTSRRIRSVDLYSRGRRQTSQAGAATNAGSIAAACFCAPAETFFLAAGPELSLWRARDGSREATLTPFSCDVACCRYEDSEVKLGNHALSAL